MSDHFVRIIPADPRFVPTRQGQEAAADLLRAVAPLAADVSSETDAQVEFRDCGGNFERVLCPACGAEIEVDIWQEWMDGDYSPKTGFRLGPITTPCCSQQTTLNQLTYELPQGFSRFVLSAMNANRLPFSAAELAQISRALGCEVRVVWQRV
jgi:hypothetical protein